MSKTMKAQVFYDAENMKLEDIPVPKVGGTDVLVKVKAVGICGSDISYYYGMSPVDTPTGKGPIVLGHEFTGVVEKVGEVPESMGLFAEGDRVVVNPVQFCNACYACAEGNTHFCENMNVSGVSYDGGFAEYALANYTGLFKLPDDVSFSEGAFTEPLACVVQALKKADIEPGSFVVVFGPGPMGQMMVQLAKSMGAGKVALVGTRDYRLEMGKKYGADYIYNIRNKDSKYYTADIKKAVADVTDGKLADRVLVPTSSNTAFEQAIDVAGNCGIIIHFGLPNEDDVIHVPALSFHTMDKEIRSSWLSPMVWPTAIRVIKNGLVDVKPLVSHTYPLEETEKAIVDLKNRVDEPMKVQIKVS
ncbi:MAG: alcohol dehydrogenase catalytic domain-containing protein [Actinomycetota bacterium]|nr:alcohol dehydrogenase catalytic domain-containing protein [Actinomycetota bacterium]